MIFFLEIKQNITFLLVTLWKNRWTEIKLKISFVVLKFSLQDFHKIDAF